MVLEEAVALQHSSLWERGRAWYAQQGPKAWATGTVPWRVSTNPGLAEGLARTVAALAEHSPGAGPTVLELGAGQGRLGFHLLRALEREAVACRVVMTDGAASNVEGWRRHDRLAPLIAQGRLEVATFDPLSPAPLALERPLGPGPLVVLANYLFDSLPHSLWRVHQGKLLEGCLRLEGEPDAAPDALSWHFELRPPREQPPGFVRGYAASLGADATFFLPTGAFACLQRLATLSPGGLVVLVADKGERTRAQVLERAVPRLARHGSASANVNFDALRAWWGPRPFLLSAGDIDFSLALLQSGLPQAATAAVRGAFEAAFVARGPLERLALLDGALAEGTSAPLGLLLSLLERSHFDPDAFLRMAPVLRARAAEVSPALLPALVAALEAVAQAHFEVGAEDLDFELATVFHRVGQLSLAADRYQASLLRRGDHPTTLFNLALVKLDLGERQAAIETLWRVTHLQPQHPGALRLLGALAHPA